MLTERFSSRYIPEPMSGCWLWIGATNGAGYGVLRDAEGKQTTAHRIAYELHKRKLTAGEVVDHLCRVKCCVNPDHLEAVSQRVNYQRGLHPILSRTGALRRLTHCCHGHPFSGENLILTAKRRACRECRRLRKLKYLGRRAAS